MFVASLARIGQFRIIQGVLGQYTDEGMAVNGSRLWAGCDLGHVAADAVGKGVNRVRRGLIQLNMTFETLSRLLKNDIKQ